MNPDWLGEPGTASGLIIVNHGDPAYPSRDGNDPSSAAAHLFLRFLGYLVFADRIAIPARYLLEGDVAYRAVMWAQDLVRQGLIVPERRAGVDSLYELAVVRELPERALRRGARLDEIVRETRIFQFDELSTTYRHLLNDDLSLRGAFRRTIAGGLSGRYVDPLTRARDHHEIHGDGTPEQFQEAVRFHAPKLANQARRWAMARYYVTPTLYDYSNTREVPADAHKLLARGRLVDLDGTAFDEARPVQELTGRLELQLPDVPVEHFYRHYCEALLAVRQKHPYARQVFADIREKSRLQETGRNLSEAFADELARQQHLREPTGQRFAINAGLIAGGVSVTATWPLGPLPAVLASMGLSIGTSYVANAVQKRSEQRAYERNRPWLLAMQDMQEQTRRTER